MKTLFLVRHAKSDWDNESLADIERPLNARGYRDAHEMSSRLFSKKQLPQLMVSSPAIRACTTALIFARNFDYDAAKLVLSEKIYEASLNTMLQIIHSLPDEMDSVMLFGHNPSFTILAEKLSGFVIENLPTCGIVCIRFEEKTWRAVSAGSLVFIDFPKNPVS